MQQIYYDGHERPDVVKYREAWTRRMLQYAKRRETWEGEEMEIVIPPTCLEPGMKKHVIVTHDECIFYSNDSQQSMWLQEGESVLKKKGNGGSIMVSKFL